MNPLMQGPQVGGPPMLFVQTDCGGQSPLSFAHSSISGGRRKRKKEEGGRRKREGGRKEGRKGINLISTNTGLANRRTSTLGFTSSIIVQRTRTARWRASYVVRTCRKEITSSYYNITPVNNYELFEYLCVVHTVIS